MHPSSTPPKVVENLRILEDNYNWRRFLFDILVQKNSQFRYFYLQQSIKKLKLLTMYLKIKDFLAILKV